MAIVAPSASAAGDTTPPTAPTDVAAAFDNCFGSYFVRWNPSTDNVDSPADLRYRFYDRDGHRMTRFDGTTDYAPNSGNTDIVPARPYTMRAVDRAGNLSAPASVGAWE